MMEKNPEEEKAADKILTADSTIATDGSEAEQPRVKVRCSPYYLESVVFEVNFASQVSATG